MQTPPHPALSPRGRGLGLGGQNAAGKKGKHIVARGNKLKNITIIQGGINETGN